MFFFLKIKFTLAKEYICSSSLEHIEVQKLQEKAMVMRRKSKHQPSPPEGQPHPAKTNTRPVEHTSAILRVLHDYILIILPALHCIKYLYHILLRLHRTIVFTILYAQEDKDEYIFTFICLCYYLCSIIFFFIYQGFGLNLSSCLADISAILSQIYTLIGLISVAVCTPKLTNMRQAHRYIGKSVTRKRLTFNV